MTRLRYYRPPPRRHPLIASGSQDHRGEEICQRCGSTWGASVHILEHDDDWRKIDQRRVGERGDQGD